MTAPKDNAHETLELEREPETAKASEPAPEAALSEPKVPEIAESALPEEAPTAPDANEDRSETPAEAETASTDIAEMADAPTAEVVAPSPNEAPADDGHVNGEEAHGEPAAEETELSAPETDAATTPEEAVEENSTVSESAGTDAADPHPQALEDVEAAQPAPAVKPARRENMLARMIRRFPTNSVLLLTAAGLWSTVYLAFIL